MELPESIECTTGLGIIGSDLVPISNVARWLYNANVNGSDIILPKENVDGMGSTFPLNSILRELQERNGNTFYSYRDPTSSPMLIQEEKVMIGIRLADFTRFIDITDKSVCTTIRDEFEHLRDSAEPLEFSFPAWSGLLEELEKMVDKDTRREFERLITAAQMENLGALDEVSVAIIAAAQSGALMYDLSRWGEDVGLGSKATFSRRKTTLQDDGIIYSEKVPVEVGRPRERVHLSDNISGVTLDIGIEDDEIGISTPSFPREDQESERLGGDEHDSSSDKRSIDDPDGEILAEIQAEIQHAIRSE